jgi:hypothetical protein
LALYFFFECLLSYFLSITSRPHTQDLSSTSRAPADCYAPARPRTAPRARGGDGYRGRRDRAPRRRRHGSRAAGLTSGSASKMASERLIATGSGRRRVSHSGRGWSRREACARAAPGRRRARTLAWVRASEDGGCRGPTASRGHITGHQAGDGERSGRIPGLASSIRLLQCNVETIILIIKYLHSNPVAAATCYLQFGLLRDKLNKGRTSLALHRM